MLGELVYSAIFLFACLIAWAAFAPIGKAIFMPMIYDGKKRLCKDCRFYQERRCTNPNNADRINGAPRSDPQSLRAKAWDGLPNHCGSWGEWWREKL